MSAITRIRLVGFCSTTSTIRSAQSAARSRSRRLLATRLSHLRGQGVVVLGIPRGGVEVAAAVSEALEAPLDVVVPRKLGAPGNAELGIGAVAEEVVVLDDRLVAALGVDRGYVEEEIDFALARLVELGYVDDRSFADGYIRRRSGSLGPLALSAELAARGVDRSVADLALTAVDFEAQLESATRLPERLCARNRPPGYRELLDSVGPKLLRRGFSLSIAREACRVAWVRTEGQAEA